MEEASPLGEPPLEPEDPHLASVFPLNPAPTRGGAEPPASRTSTARTEAPSPPDASWRLTVQPGLGELTWVLEGPRERSNHVTVSPQWAQVQASLKANQPDQVAGHLADGLLSEFLRPVGRNDALTLALSPSIEPYPWEWIVVEGEPLCMRYRLNRAPVGVSEAARGLPGSSRPPTREWSSRKSASPPASQTRPPARKRDTARPAAMGICSPAAPSRMLIRPS